MAKKNENLSAEELMELALVPEHEWPFGVPENWVWIRGSHLFEDMTTKKPTGEYFYYIDIDSIDNKNQVVKEAKKINVSEAPSRARRGLRDGDILFSLVRPYLMNIAYIDQDLKDCIASTGFFVCRPKYNLNTKYFFRLMTSNYVVDGLNRFMKGDNSPSIRSSDITEFFYPLPPLAEQQRIVDRVESLFEKLDQAKGLIQDALDSFENRKAAILHKAFSGELTKKWREENGIGMESWEENYLKNVLDVRDGTHDSPQYHKSGYALITSKNLKNGYIFFNDIKYINKNDYEKINLRSQVNVGDILFAMIGTIGNPVVVTDEPNYAIKNVALLKTIQKIDSFYVKYYLESNFVKEKMAHEAKGSTQKFVSLGYLRDFPISVPTIIEQKEIVRILGSLLSNEVMAREYLDVVNSVDIMKKSILTRAFRGELGTNDSYEESAIHLIEKMFSESGGENN